MMAVLLRTALSPLCSKWPLFAKTLQPRHFSTFLLPATGTITEVTHPHTQDLTYVQQVCVTQNLIQRRNFYSYFKKKKSLEEIKYDDKVEPHYELVYKAHSISYVQMGYGGVQATAGIAVCLAVMAAVFGTSQITMAVFQEQPLEVAMFVIVNLLICVGILRVCTWYPFRIYYSELEDQFVAVFVGSHPLAVRHVKLLPGEVKPSPPGRVAAVIAPWSHHIYSTPTQKIHLNVEHFIYPLYYNKLLGYVKEY